MSVKFRGQATLKVVIFWSRHRKFWLAGRTEQMRQVLQNWLRLLRNGAILCEKFSRPQVCCTSKPIAR